MRLSLVLACALAAALFAGCRQADGPMPAPTDDIPNRIDDVARDLLNVVGGDPDAPAELSDDLASFTAGDAAREAVVELGRRVSKAVTGRKLTEDSARSLAGQLWLGTAARELSERQRETVINGLRDMLVAMEIPREDVEAVATQANEVQKAVGERSRRWYERY